MRYVLLDRITKLVPPLASAVKCVSLSDDTFLDHFPGHPVMPGALILESLAQLGGVLLEQAMREKGRNDLHAVLTMVDRAKFRQVVRPGDRMELEAQVVSVSEDGGQVEGTAKVDAKTVAEMTIGYAFARVTNEAQARRRREYLNVWLTGSSEG
jgi:3-hydroxymyristoyl/3-hydroxydecanoyl-(acyl carrier protein) dehydratase